MTTQHDFFFSFWYAVEFFKVYSITHIFFQDLKKNTQKMGLVLK